MKYFYFIIIIYLLFTSCKVKKNAVKYDDFSCEAGVKEAIEDANKGIYKLISYGLTINIKTDGFRDFYKNYMLNNYNIYYSSGGCVIYPSSQCYREKIEKLIYDNYGKNFFEESELKAIQEFRKTQEFIDVIKPEIDSGKIYSSYKLNKKPKFKVDGKEVVFTKYLGFANFQKDYFNRGNYCEITFVIEKDGAISNIKFNNLETRESLTNKKLMNKLQSIHKWLPGEYLSEAVRTKISIDVPLRLFEKYPR